MVEPIRKGHLSIPGLDLPTGLYIVGDSNSRERNIPHLPTIEAKNPTEGVDNFKLKGCASDVSHAESLFENFSNGDIVWFDSKQSLFRCILSKNANSNTLLVTEQCDNRCIFCSQPPNELSDIELYQKATLSILNYNQDDYIGISGGEPTLNRHGFLTMLSMLERFNNSSPLHILTNGRSFSDIKYVNKVKPLLPKMNVVWGIPLYGARGEIHDSLVKSKGAFVETVKGLINLGLIGQFIELRIIPVKSNFKNLIHLMEFITSSLPHIGAISIMNLEPKGWARNNYNDLYVSVNEQSDTLVEMIKIARLRGFSIRLFNYPLCLMPESIRDYACQSISDWKNYFPLACDPCVYKSQCCGFFTSSTGKYLELVEPLKWIN